MPALAGLLHGASACSELCLVLRCRFFCTPNERTCRSLADAYCCLACQGLQACLSTVRKVEGQSGGLRLGCRWVALVQCELRSIAMAKVFHAAVDLGRGNPSCVPSMYGTCLSSPKAIEHLANANRTGL